MTDREPQAHSSRCASRHMGECTCGEAEKQEAAACEHLFCPQCGRENVDIDEGDEPQSASCLDCEYEGDLEEFEP